jgi:hypothetical protein
LKLTERSSFFEQPLDRIVEQANEILCSVVAADGEGSASGVDLCALGDPLRARSL